VQEESMDQSFSLSGVFRTVSANASSSQMNSGEWIQQMLPPGSHPDNRSWQVSQEPTQNQSIIQTSRGRGQTSSPLNDSRGGDQSQNPAQGFSSQHQVPKKPWLQGSRKLIPKRPQQPMNTEDQTW
ncbi:MAG TPA: hypothetical protein VFN23_10965, partial [Ktedonobacteraceae bacterium]|nr:hypothetical protein [Ktedonobacteraceae bacterium]